ncbi:unnamed protein product [Aphanomyces euteiches]
MERKFHSPLGKSGAVYSITVWVINAIAIIGFQGDDQKSFLTFILILVVCTVYYHLYAKHHQKFSEEERMSLFFAHVANHNNLKRSNRSNRSRKKFTLKVLELAKKLSEKKKLLSPTRQVLSKETSITQQPQDGSKFKSSNASKIVSKGPPRV